MRDFATNSDERKKFILGYKKDNDAILVKLASGETYSVPNNKANIDKLNELIQKQIDFSINSKVPKYTKIDKNLFILETCCVPVSALLAYISSGLEQKLWKFSLFFGILGCAAGASKFADYRVKKSEKEKFVVFNNVKDELNEMIASDECLLDGISFTAGNTIKCALQRGEHPFTAINIDKFTKKDLLRIKSNLEKSKALNFPNVFVSDEQKEAVRLRNQRLDSNIKM